jgi:DNA-binding transcriptional MerR regulator
MTNKVDHLVEGEADEMYSITELARELGVTPRTLRFYEDKGLLKPQRVGGTRVYVQRDRARLIIILRGKRLGFSLKEISEYLDLYDADPTQRAQIDRLLNLVRERIGLLEQQRDALEETLSELREIEQLSLDAIDKTEDKNKGGNDPDGEMSGTVLPLRGDESD